MALISPLKQDVEKATRDLEALNRLYNVYFQGGEDEPPKPQRKTLDALVVKIKGQLVAASNASDKFQANTFVARYQTLTTKWDKSLRAIETGLVPKPKKRE